MQIKEPDLLARQQIVNVGKAKSVSGVWFSRELLVERMQEIVADSIILDSSFGSPT